MFCVLAFLITRVADETADSTFRIAHCYLILCYPCFVLFHARSRSSIHSHLLHFIIHYSPFNPPPLTDEDDDLFDSDEEEEISKRVLDGEDGASGPPEGWNGGRGKAGKKVCSVCFAVVIVCVMLVGLWL